MNFQLFKVVVTIGIPTGNVGKLVLCLASLDIPRLLLFVCQSYEKRLKSKTLLVPRNSDKEYSTTTSNKSWTPLNEILKVFKQSKRHQEKRDRTKSGEGDANKNKIMKQTIQL